MVKVLLEKDEIWPAFNVLRNPEKHLKLGDPVVEIPEALADRFDTLNRAWHDIQKDLRVYYEDASKTYISEE